MGKREKEKTLFEYYYKKKKNQEIFIVCFQIIHWYTQAKIWCFTQDLPIQAFSLSTTQLAGYGLSHGGWIGFKRKQKYTKASET